MDKPGDIIGYLRHIRENVCSSRQLGAEFGRFVKRYFKTWEVLGVETATRIGYAGYYVPHLGKRIM